MKEVAEVEAVQTGAMAAIVEGSSRIPGHPAIRGVKRMV